MKNLILNSKGKPVLLSERELKLAQVNQRLVNELGYEIDVTTLTTISKKITEQKFFQVAPADFLPVRVGDGAWSSNLVTYTTSAISDDFSTGVINTGSGNSRLASADAGVDAVPVKVINWAKTIGWTLFDLQQAAKSGNWDLVTSKEEARLKNWQLGIQKIAFLGLQGDAQVRGLLTLVGVTNNTSVITAPIKSMDASALKAFCNSILDVYRSNCQRTAMPTHFVIPESDYLGLAGPASATFPIKSVLDLLLETFRTMTQNPGFQILPLAYADAQYNSLGVQRYALYNYEETSLRMDLPVDYTNTLANSVDNFSFQNVGYGQFTGVGAYRPREIMYFSYTPSPAP